MSDLSQYTNGFNANEVETQSFEPVPPGKYLAQIEDAELKNTKSGGAGLNLKFKVATGQHSGRILFDWINLAHPTSTKCVEIGQQQLAGLCKALSVVTVTNTNELLGKQIGLQVAIDKDDSTRNEVKGYINPNESAPVAAAPVAQPAPAPASGGAMPWA